jgi:hypothetical protein
MSCASCEHHCFLTPRHDMLCAVVWSIQRLVDCMEEGEEPSDSHDSGDSHDSHDSEDFDCDKLPQLPLSNGTTLKFDCDCALNICVMLGLIVIMRTQGCICGGLQIFGKKCLGDAQGGGVGARETDVAWTGGGNVHRPQSVTNRPATVAPTPPPTPPPEWTEQTDPTTGRTVPCPSHHHTPRILSHDSSAAVLVHKRCYF